MWEAPVSSQQVLFFEGNNFPGTQFASQDYEARSKLGLLLQEK